MKTIYTCSSILLLMMFGWATAADTSTDAAPKPAQYLSEKARAVNHRLLIGPQPQLNDFQGLKLGGVQRVINFRTPDEMKKLPFRENEELAKLGIDYVEIPVGGSKYAYSPAQLKSLTEALNGDEKTLLHCASGQRASVIAVAYLVTEGGMSVNEAVQHAKGWWPLALQNVLGQELSLSIKTASD